jgi:glutamyl/glutaminyl-tRNA synthetase
LRIADFALRNDRRSDDPNQKSKISNVKSEIPYRGRLAPSPTGYLHIGHACTFWQAQERSREAGGQLVLRIEDLDEARCRPEFRDSVIEDLSWFGLEWDEGPDVGGVFAPYVQSRRRSHYVDFLRQLWDAGVVYGCTCSRKDVAGAATAPHAENEEPIYPGTCRDLKKAASFESLLSGECNVRFRVPDGETVRFSDGRAGEQAASAGKDFGDFVVWRRDDVPAYHLAVVADDIAMRITEVVRGEDLLLSTFRHLLLYRALNIEPPVFYHAQLIVDEEGRRLAKRHAPLSLRALRAAGVASEDIRARFI